MRHGAVTRYTKKPRPHFALSNQPAEFYFGLGKGNTFDDPIRDSLGNHFVPIFYSDIWGDYWAYFLIYGTDTRTDKLACWHVKMRPRWLSTHTWFETNRYTINSYLGMVNRLAVFPSVLALASVGLGVVSLTRFSLTGDQRREVAALALLTLVVIVSFAGFLGFLIRYPNTSDWSNIKATYMLQIFPPVAILMGACMERIKRKFALGIS